MHLVNFKLNSITNTNRIHQTKIRSMEPMKTETFTFWENSKNKNIWKSYGALWEISYLVQLTYWPFSNPLIQKWFILERIQVLIIKHSWRRKLPYKILWLTQSISLIFFGECLYFVYWFIMLWVHLLDFRFIPRQLQMHSLPGKQQQI